jgi:hypothetical protein
MVIRAPELFNSGACPKRFDPWDVGWLTYERLIEGGANNLTSPAELEPFLAFIFERDRG